MGCGQDKIMAAMVKSELCLFFTCVPHVFHIEK